MDSLNKFETALSGFEAEIKNFQKLAETQKQLGNIQKDCQQLLTNYQVFSDSVKILLANYEKFRSDIETTMNKVTATNANFITGVETKITNFETKQKENFANLESKNRAQIEEKFEQLKSNEKAFEIFLTNAIVENQKNNNSILANIEAKIINFESAQKKNFSNLEKDTIVQIETKFEQLETNRERFEVAFSNAMTQHQKSNETVLEHIKTKITNFETKQTETFANFQTEVFIQIREKFEELKNQQTAFKTNFAKITEEHYKNNEVILANIETKVVGFEAKFIAQMAQKFDDFKNQQIAFENTIKTELAQRLEAIEVKIIANQKKQFFVLLFISLLLLLVLVLKK